MEITDLYQTKIEASSYNVNIDSTGNVITVTLLDFNNQPVTNKSVTLTCDKGYFTKKGSTNISGTTTKSVTVNTDSNGKITATWTASEWGLCTFSANSNTIQINVKGWRTIQESTPFTIKANSEGIAELSLHYGSTVTIGEVNKWWDVTASAKPSQDVGTIRNNYGVNWLINLTAQGELKIGTVNGSSVQVGALWGQLIYKL